MTQKYYLFYSFYFETMKSKSANVAFAVDGLAPKITTQMQQIEQRSSKPKSNINPGANVTLGVDTDDNQCKQI